MGFAIIIIVFYHFFIDGGETMTDRILRKCFRFGYTGVDIFMVVSGLGLTYSMSKNENLKDYYLRRWLRIFPFFTFITLIYCWLIKGESIGLSLLRSTTIGYWIGIPYIDWYVPAIAGLYTIFPLLYFYVVKPLRYQLALVIGAFFLIASILLVNSTLLDWKHYALLYRVPDFIIGCMIGAAIKNGYKKMCVKMFVIVSIALGAFIFAILKDFKLLHLCYTPLYLYILCHIFEKLSNFRFGLLTRIPLVLSFFGGITLELYRVSSCFELLLTNDSCPKYHYAFSLLYFTISAVVAFMCSKIFNYINKYLYILLKRTI